MNKIHLAKAEVGEWKTRRAETGNYERRSSERYEGRTQLAIKDAQRHSVADWLNQHHKPGERMRLLSLPDLHWTFESRMNARPNTTFLGLQRDWATLERSVPWMPMMNDLPSWADENRACHFHATAATGEIQGYRRGKNAVFHMWAGHLLSFDNLASRKGLIVDIRARRKEFRGVTAAWLDFTGFLTDEITSAVAGLPVMMGGRETYPVVVSFLACRDGFRDHEERVARLLISLQQSQWRNGWRFRFDRFEIHSGTSPFISVFGAYHFKDRDRLPVAKEAP